MVRPSSPVFLFGTELYGRQSPNTDFAPHISYADLWTRTFFGPSFSLDLGMSFGLNSQSPVRQYMMGLTFYSPTPGEEEPHRKRQKHSGRP